MHLIFMMEKYQEKDGSALKHITTDDLEEARNIRTRELTCRLAMFGSSAKQLLLFLLFLLGPLILLSSPVNGTYYTKTL